MRMGFNDQDIVELSGAHNIGRCHTNRSGFEGRWVHSPTRFSNQYFRLLMRLEWKLKKLDNGVLQFVHIDEDLGEELMMLPTDMALQTDPSFKEWVVRYADYKEVFYADFAKAFTKLMELGIQRDAQGKVANLDNLKGRYHSAPKKASKPGLPNASNEEAKPLRMEHERFRARL